MKTRKERSRPEPGLRRTLARALLAALAGVPCVVHAQAWSLNANGNWNVPGNWTPAAFPDATGAAAVLGNAITASRTITLGQNITVGSLAIDNANAYIVTGSTLSFAPASGSGTLAVTAVNGNGAHTVSSAIGLGSGLVVSNASTGTLTLSGVISGAGGLTKAGTGRLALGAVNTYGGPTVIENGALDYNVGTAIPGTSAVTVGDGAGAAASAQLVFNTTVPSAAALNVTVASDGVVVQGNNRLVRLASIAGSGEMRINSTVGQLFELNGTGGDTTYAGLVTGGIATASFDPNAGSRLAKSGASTIAFAGANTFVARLFITGGAIRAANASALGAASAGTSNATFVSGAGALELDGGITVAERVYLNGAGPGGSGALRSVTGSNVLTGGVTLGWTGGAVAPAAVSIGAAAGSTLTLSGVVDGTQSLTKVGDGTVVLNAVNTWSGGTTVNAGVLRLGVAAGLPNAAPLAVNGGTLDLAGASRSVTSLSGTGGSIALGAGTLTVNQATDTTYAGSIAGSGALVKAGAGVLALTGTTTHTGGTAVNAGTLQGTAASLQGTIANAATVVFDQAADGTFNGALSGAGTVRKRGAGTLVVAGPQSYAGPTTVEAGTLQVNGALASAVNVLGGAAIAGTGTVGALTVSSGATVAPGSAAAPYGTLVVNGAYAHAAGAALRVNVDAAGQASRLQVNGPATLAGGQVDARAAPGNYARSTSYTLLDASGGVTGAFGGVTIDAAFLSPVLVYEPGRVRLTLTRNSLPFADAALTPNQRAVATALDGAAAAGATGDMATVLSAVSNLSAPAARAAYESMGGLMYALLPSFGVTDASQFLSLSAQRLSSRRNVAATRSADLGAAASAPLQNDALAALAGTLLPLADQAHRSVWVVASGLGGSMDGDASGGDYDNRAGSIAFGADTALSDRWTLGAAGGYSRWRITNDGRGDRADVDVYRVAAYARYADGPLRLDGAVALARLDYDTARRIAFGTIDRQASADYDSTQASARLEGGYAMPWRRYVFEPYANFTYVRERVDAFQETGAGSVSLAVSERTANSTRAGAGLRVAREFDLGGAPAAAQVLAGYARELSGVPSFDALMIGDPSRTAMTITAETYDRNSAILGAMLAVAPRRNLVLRLDAGAELRGDYDSLALAASLRYLW